MDANYYVTESKLNQGNQVAYSAFFNGWTKAEVGTDAFDDFVDDFRKPVESKEKKGPAFCPFIFKDNYRNDDNATQSQLLVFDLDDLPIGTTADDIVSLLNNYRAFCYSTYSHLLDGNGPRFRVVILLDDCIDPASYKKITRQFCKTHKYLNQADESGYKPTQVFFLPSVPPGRKDSFEFAESFGKPLDWTQLILDEPVSTVQETSDSGVKTESAIDLIFEGTRNKTLYRIGLKLRSEGKSESEVLTRLLQINETRCAPQLQTEEVIGIAKSACKREVLPKFYSETFTHKSVGESLLDDQGSNLIYCSDYTAWFLFDEETGYWNECTDELVRSLILKKIVSHIEFVSTTELIADKDRPGYISKLERLSSANFVDGVKKLLPSVQYKDFIFENFDESKHLVGLSDGQCLDLKAATVRAIRREDYLTKSTGIRFDKSADCPTWKRSVLEWCEGDIELAKYLKQLVGYSLSGETTDQRLYFLYGSGLNGKSVFINIISALFGENCIGIDSSTLMNIKNKGGDANPDVVRLAGVRAATCNELPNQGTLNEAFTKQLTAGDPITGRPLYKGVITFRPVAKLFISGNHKPIIHGRDDGIWRRMTLIPFEAKIEKPDPYLELKLKEELSGILNWATEGWIEYQKAGKLVRPQVVEDACKEYRSDMDILSTWLDENVIQDTNGKLLMKDLYSFYRLSFIEQGLKPMSQPSLSKELRSKYGAPIRGSAGMFFKGYRISR